MTVRRIEQIPVIAVGQTDQFQEEVDIEHGGGGFSKPERQIVKIEMRRRRKSVSEESVRQRAFHDHHGKSGDNARDEEKERQVHRIPKRVQFCRRYQEKRTEAGLMHSAKHYSQDRQPYRQSAPEPPYTVPSEPLPESGHKFKGLNGKVGSHAHTDFEKHRSDASRE